MTKAQLDREVAIKIMGMNSLNVKKVPKYSSDMSEAMKILDVMRNSGHRWMIISSEQGYFLRRLANVTHDLDRDEKRYTADKPLGHICAQNGSELARVICEAALAEIKK